LSAFSGTGLDLIKAIQAAEEGGESEIILNEGVLLNKVLPNKNNNTDNNTFKIKVKPNLNNIKSQGWHHS
jgi:hypothetical protein